MHWAAKYIGMKHMRGGRGGRGVDCWGLLRLVYQEQFNIELPSYPGITSESVFLIASCINAEIHNQWVEVMAPFDGCAIGMSQRTIVHHVGFFADTDGGKVVHCWEAHDVIADSIRRIRLKGFKGIHFYRHILWPTSSRFPTPSNLQSIPENTESPIALP